MIENPKNKVNFKRVLRIVRHSSIPLAVVASCGLITLFGADRWILRNLEEQRDLNFRQVVSNISLQLSENVLLSSYNNIDTLLLRILDEDIHITCLAVADNNGKFLSIASREKPGSKASIKYGLPPENCRDNSDQKFPNGTSCQQYNQQYLEEYINTFRQEDENCRFAHIHGVQPELRHGPDH